MVTASTGPPRPPPPEDASSPDHPLVDTSSAHRPRSSTDPASVLTRQKPNSKSRSAAPPALPPRPSLDSASKLQSEIIGRRPVSLYLQPHSSPAPHHKRNSSTGSSFASSLESPELGAHRRLLKSESRKNEKEEEKSRKKKKEKKPHISGPLYIEPINGKEFKKPPPPHPGKKKSSEVPSKCRHGDVTEYPRDVTTTSQDGRMMRQDSFACFLEKDVYLQTTAALQAEQRRGKGSRHRVGSVYE